MFIELNRVSIRSRSTFNLAHVLRVRPTSTGGSRLLMSDGKDVAVEEGYDDVTARIWKATGQKVVS